MQLTRELPDYAYTLRAANGQRAKVNDRTLMRSFILSPNHLLEDWPVTAVSALKAADLAPALAQNPVVFVLGTGERQIFPPTEIMAACLTKGIGIEVMNNASAARTFNVLAAEGRQVVAGFVLAAAGT